MPPNSVCVLTATVVAVSRVLTGENPLVIRYGAGVVLPAILCYAAFLYRIFRRKATPLCYDWVAI